MKWLCLQMLGYIKLPWLKSGFCEPKKNSFWIILTYKCTNQSSKLVERCHGYRWMHGIHVARKNWKLAGHSYWVSLSGHPILGSKTDPDPMWHVDAEPACRHVSALGRMRHMYYTCILWFKQTRLNTRTNMTGWWLGTFWLFPYIGKNHPNWLSYFSEGFKPPTRINIHVNLHMYSDYATGCIQKFAKRLCPGGVTTRSERVVGPSIPNIRWVQSRDVTGILTGFYMRFLMRLNGVLERFRMLNKLGSQSLRSHF
jgi:hypothetical protein